MCYNLFTKLKNISLKERQSSMRIRTVSKRYEEVLALTPKKHQKPLRTNPFFRTLLKVVSVPDLLAVHFRCNKIGMDRLKKDQPCLYLMNHSSFVDLEIAASIRLYSHQQVCIGHDVDQGYLLCSQAFKILRSYVSGGKLQL